MTVFYFKKPFGRLDNWRFDGNECKQVDIIPSTAKRLSSTVYVGVEEEGEVEGIFLLREYLEESYFTTQIIARKGVISGALKRNFGIAFVLLEPQINLYQVRGMDAHLFSIIRLLDSAEFVLARNKDEVRALVARELLKRI